MEQFSLEKHLENPSRKVVTRDGREVRIVFTEAQDDNYPILALVQRKTETQKEQPHLFSTHGVYEVGRESCLDLFFADEEEGLTEFDKCLLSAFYSVAGKAVTTIGPASFQEDVNEWSKTLLDLARKELLKDLLKWKKSTLPIPDEEYPTGFNCKYFCYKGYCIDYKKLFETLPKEE